jgi:N-acyl-D-amino-acid deacylase
MTQRKACLILIVALTVNPLIYVPHRVFAQVPTSGEALPGTEAFDSLVPAFMDRHHIPGVGLAVAFEGRLVLVRGYGLAKQGLFSRVPLQPSHRFRYASLSKAITATAILQLCEQGKLTLDGRVIDLLPGIDPRRFSDSPVRQITVRHLLEHRAGFDREKSGDPMFRARPPCPDGIAGFLREGLDFTPGERYAYSNIGYCLLGRVIEQVTGRVYGDFIREHVLLPAGAQTIILGTSDGSQRDEVTYHELLSSQGPARGAPYRLQLEAMDAHGGWIGTATDYLRFLLALRGDRSPRLFAPATWETMLATPDDPSLVGKPVHYGKGLFVRRLPNGGRNVWHSGSLPGTLTFAVLADNGYAWVALANARPDNLAHAPLDLDRTLWEGIRSLQSPPSGHLVGLY